MKLLAPVYNHTAGGGAAGVAAGVDVAAVVDVDVVGVAADSFADLKTYLNRQVAVAFVELKICLTRQVAAAFVA